MPLAQFPPDDVMQAVARENNLSETAFLVPENGDYRIRWFTPAAEVPLCGHATLAGAAVVMERLEPARTAVVFHSASGPLEVHRAPAGYRMDLPARPGEPVAPPLRLAEILGVVPDEVLGNDFNLMAVLPNPAMVRSLSPDVHAIACLDHPGLIVTAPGDQGYDLVSRYFAPAKGVPEDPVTGSAHCMLTPYWAQRLGRTSLRAWQASARGGQILCTLRGGRVELEGQCVFYLEGEAEI